MPYFEYGPTGCNAVGSYYEDAQRIAGKTAKAKQTRLRGQEVVASYQAWRAATDADSEVFSASSTLKILALAGLTSLPENSKPAVVAEAADRAISKNEIEKLRWLFDLGLPKTPGKCARAANRDLGFEAESGLFLELSSWSGLAARLGSMRALVVLEELGIAKQDREIFFAPLFTEARSSASKFDSAAMASHPWVASHLFSDKRAEQKAAAAYVSKAWAPQSEGETLVCWRALSEQAIATWNKGAAKHLATMDRDMEVELKPGALLSLTLALVEAQNGSLDALDFSQAAMSWFAKRSGPDSGQVLESLLGKFEEAVADRDYIQIEHCSCAIASHAKLGSSVGKWAKILSENAREASSKITAILASGNLSLGNEQCRMAHKVLKAALIDFDAMAGLELGVKSAPAKTL